MFTVSATGLQPDRSYSFRGYAINDGGTAYSAAASFTTLAVAGIAITTSPAETAAGSALAPPLVARLVDREGATVTGASATLRASLGTHPGASTLSGSTTVTTSGGVATFGPLSLTQTGTGYTFSIADESPATTFTERSAAASSTWQSVAYGSAGYVAMAPSSTPSVMRSVDGRTWVGVTAGVPPTSAWASVTFGNGRYVAVASSGTQRVMTSTDGLTWSAANLPEQAELRSVTYGDGRFVAVASSGTKRVMTSANGTDWTGHVVPLADWQAVTHGNGLFVAVSTVNEATVMTSPDGATWTA